MIVRCYRYALTSAPVQAAAFEAAAQGARLVSLHAVLRFSARPVEVSREFAVIAGTACKSCRLFLPVRSSLSAVISATTNAALARNIGPFTSCRPDQM